jgi:lysozyme family protein
MVTNNYPEPILKPLVLNHEGGKVNDSRDPGGKTNQGVIQRTFSAWLKKNGMKDRDVYTMKDWERDVIYAELYWEKVRGPELPSGLDYVLMDVGVNSGPSRGVKLFQSAHGIKPRDGVFGPITMSAVHAMRSEPDGPFVESKVEDSIRKNTAERMAFLMNLPHWPTYKNGWTRRVNEVRSKAIEMARWPSNIKKDGAAGIGGGAVIIEDQVPDADIGLPDLPEGVIFIVPVLVALYIAYNHREWVAMKFCQVVEWFGDLKKAGFNPARFVQLRRDIANQRATPTIEG